MQDEIRTRRLILRPLRLGDTTRLQCLANDWAVASMVAAIPHPYEIAHALDFIIRIAPEAIDCGDALFAIAWQDEPDALIGCIGCHHKGEDGFPDLGYWLGRPYWGQGVMSEAVEAMVGHLFSIWRVNALSAGYFNENAASKRVLNKMGFRDLGPKMYPCLARGAPVEGRIMRLSRAKWLARKDMKERMI